MREQVCRARLSALKQAGLRVASSVERLAYEQRSCETICEGFARLGKADARIEAA